MIDKETAKKIACEYIETLFFEGSDEYELVLMDEYTIEKPYGWIFSYNTKKFLLTKDYGDALVSNGPVIVNKETGSLTPIGGGPFMKEEIREYEIKISEENF